MLSHSSAYDNDYKTALAVDRSTNQLSPRLPRTLPQSTPIDPIFHSSSCQVLLPFRPKRSLGFDLCLCGRTAQQRMSVSMRADPHWITRYRRDLPLRFFLRLGDNRTIRVSVPSLRINCERRCAIVILEDHCRIWEVWNESPFKRIYQSMPRVPNAVASQAYNPRFHPFARPLQDAATILRSEQQQQPR